MIQKSGANSYLEFILIVLFFEAIMYNQVIKRLLTVAKWEIGGSVASLKRMKFNNPYPSSQESATGSKCVGSYARQKKTQ